MYMSAVFNIGSKIWTLKTIFDEEITLFKIIISLGIDFRFKFSNF